jgi:hypothetical protein
MKYKKREKKSWPREVGLLQDRKIARYENPIGIFLLQTNITKVGFLFLCQKEKE